MRKIFTAFIALLAGATFASAQADSTSTIAMAHTGSAASLATVDYSVPMAPKAFPNIKIANFGQMDERLYRGERHYGAFARSLRLPANVDASKVTAEFKNGVLTVVMPKTAEARGKVIPIAIV